jgi:CheY-like chemotaxis protein
MGNQMGDEIPPGSRGRWKVLIVDDEQDLRDSFRELLEGEGYTVLEAANGRAALDILRTSRYPLVVLLDMMMPLMRGDSVIDTLIKERALPGKHVIALLTASPATVPRAIQSVLTKFQIEVIRKTLPMEELLALIEQAQERITLQQGRPL